MSVDDMNITQLENQVVEYFADGVKVLGLPKSVGEIYGLLFISKKPLALNELVERLDISKGTGSQGLKMLRTLGAVSEVNSYEGRKKVCYQANVELKELVSGFIRQEIRPHLNNAKDKVQRMDDNSDAFYNERIKRLESWRKKAGLVIPILQKFLGG